MKEPDFSGLTRPIQPIPDAVKQALEARRLWEAFRARPAYQQNDYLSWIQRAVRPATRRKRLEQMLDELERGDLYMKMDYKPKTPKSRRSGP